VILGPINDPLKLSAEEFVNLIGSVKGGDGFYVEYRNLQTLKYNPLEKTPDWVEKNIIDASGFGVFSGV
jgi:hypothetical protein